MGDGTTIRLCPASYPNGFARARLVYNAGGHFYILGSEEYPSNVTAKDIYRAYTTVLLETKQYLEQDQSFDEEQQMRNQAQSRLMTRTDRSLALFRSDKAIFDPIELLDPLWKGGSWAWRCAPSFLADDFHETLAPHTYRD